MDNKEVDKIQKVSEICAAYELGYSAGMNAMGEVENEFPTNTSTYFAWILGHNTGTHNLEVEYGKTLH